MNYVAHMPCKAMPHIGCMA